MKWERHVNISNNTFTPLPCNAVPMIILQDKYKGMDMSIHQITFISFNTVPVAYNRRQTNAKSFYLFIMDEFYFSNRLMLVQCMERKNETSYPNKIP